MIEPKRRFRGPASNAFNDTRVAHVPPLFLDKGVYIANGTPQVPYAAFLASISNCQ